MIKKIVIACMAVASMAALADESIDKGKQRAAVCASCHGAVGISNGPVWPNLAGQKAGYLMKQLKDFRSGTRKDPMMSAMAAPLTDEDIKNLAAYYSSLK
ncbi:cytochrome c [Halioxenophilus sp. WMMB6]|uniref:c-type cytochrome n=1 Tax=Halioxenophilus sp. WMMB6 TaxID=3073815 RepID=UPI00295E8227|nr:cytochrome c [Halioxenophilus sp. WMMB6]